ncbi:hypothetical protein [Tabrizicola sp.]|uniref:hypothetical protein n=1 Tax=Tabrizicola sp. TaxID=2005166 RepID=UPI003F67B32E
MTQLIFNADYPGVVTFGPTYLPMLGINVSTILAILSLHAGWSICASIALIEVLVAKRRTEPWLPPRGVWAVFTIFVTGAAFITWSEIVERQFIASPLQLGISAGVIAILIFGALRIRMPAAAFNRQFVPPPWLLALWMLILTMLLLVVIDTGTWWGVAGWIVIVTGLISSLAVWSSREGWSPRHRVGAVGGAILTYAWIGFPQVPTIGTPGPIDTVGNAIFAAIAVSLVVRAWRGAERVRRT